MTAPSPRLRTAWRLGSALAAAAGSAVVTSALVDRSRRRAQRNRSPGQADGGPGAAALAAAATPTAEPEPVAPAADPEPLVAEPAAPVTPAPTERPRTPSDDLARAIEAADAVEAAPAAWARAASGMRAQTTAADTGWAPSTAALAGASEQLVARSPAPLPPAGPETPPGLPAVTASPAWDYELSDVDTRVPRLPGEPDRRKPRRKRYRDEEPAAEATAHPTNGVVAEGATAPPDVTPDRRMLLFVGVAVAVALLLGVGLVVLGSGADDDGGPERAGANPTTQGGADGAQPPATPVSRLTPDQAFAQAAQRLTAAASFAYQGSSRATDVSPVRPGPWLAVGLTVQGHVRLDTSRLFERGTADDGSVVETTTDGRTIWGRSATSFAGLEDVPIETVYTLPPPGPTKVGALLLPQWLAAATGATASGPDDQGRTTFRATLPAAVLGTIQDDVAPVDATMVVAFDQDGDPVHLEISTPDGPAALRLVFEITDLGEQTAIPIPGEAPATAGSNDGSGPTATTGATAGTSTTVTGAGAGPTAGSGGSATATP